ncbi:MAG: hypothetical protein ACI97A_004455 [Planctomycetota bacterium]|jgi:hypothetical protein
MMPTDLSLYSLVEKIPNQYDYSKMLLAEIMNKDFYLSMNSTARI